MALRRRTTGGDKEESGWGDRRPEMIVLKKLLVSCREWYTQSHFIYQYCYLAYLTAVRIWNRFSVYVLAYYTVNKCSLYYVCLITLCQIKYSIQLNSNAPLLDFIWQMQNDGVIAVPQADRSYVMKR